MPRLWAFSTNKGGQLKLSKPKEVILTEEVLVGEENLMGNYEQEITSLKAILECPEFNMNFAPDPVQTPKPTSFKICYCGILLQESPKGEFRCSQCGCIKYERVME